MKPFATTALRTAMLAVALTAPSAQAHRVWLEQSPQGAKLYFGEFGQNLREASPGLLDKFIQPVAHKLTTKGVQALTVSKTLDGFAIAGSAQAAESLIAEESAYPITDRKDGDKAIRSRYVPAARLVTDFSKHAPHLTLDLVTTGQSMGSDVQVQALFQGKPLPKTKITIVTVSGWEQEHQTDDNGMLTVKLPWSGTYVLELSYQDNSPGTRGTDSYDRSDYVTSLTITQGKGLSPLPAAPAATPNKMK